MRVRPINVEMRNSSRSLRLKQAVIAAFCEPAPSVRARLVEFTNRDWQRAKLWLDVSGLAIYFLDRLRALGLENCIPLFLLNQLRRDFADNCERTASLFSEAVTLSGLLQRQNLKFAFLKGITLPPESVANCALRNQMDIDLLVRDGDAFTVQKCLEGLGYVLDAKSGMTWEFKAGASGTSSLKNLYKIRSERTVEVHLLGDAGSAGEPPQSDRLARARHRSIRGAFLPALSLPDLFVQQALHLFKHMCGEHTRLSWVLEFWKHVCARRNDKQFWSEVELIATREPQANVAIGAATLLTSLVFGPFAPEALSRWSMEKIPPTICLWIQMYGRHNLFSDSPCSKLYLLLRQQLRPASAAEQAARRRLIFPIHWPQRITRAEANERIASRLRRYSAEARFFMYRMRFHAVEGARFAFESLRWQRRLSGVTQ